MTKEKNRELIDLVCNTHPFKPSKVLFEKINEESDTSDWEVKCLLARFLIHPSLGREAEALELFQDALKESDGMEMDQDAADQKAWMLRDLSGLEHHRNNHEKALDYIQQAIQIADTRKCSYSFTIRGELVYRKLDILCAMGRENEAMAEADQLIEEHADSRSTNDSYIFFCYRFKAQQAARRNNPANAREFLLKSLNFTKQPNEWVEKGRRALSEYKIGNTACSEAMNHMLQYLPNECTQIVWWDMPGEPDWENIPHPGDCAQ